MIKLVGAVTVFSVFGWCGYEKKRWYAQRVNCLRQWQNALLEGERMLCDLGLPTPDFVKQLEQYSSLREAAKHCLLLLQQEETFEPAWKKAIERANLPLYREEAGMLIELGQILGRYDGDEQRRVIKVQLSRIEELLRHGEEECRCLGRMWSVLGLSLGALAVILLY